MIEVIPGAPEGVLAFKAVGEVTADDYDDVLEPAVEQMIAEQGAVRIVYVLGPEWTGYTAGAVWEDTKVGIGKISKWQRCAVVTNRDWLEHAAKAFAWIEPGEVKIFGVDELDEAMAWAAG